MINSMFIPIPFFPCTLPFTFPFPSAFNLVASFACCVSCFGLFSFFHTKVCVYVYIYSMHQLHLVFPLLCFRLLFCLSNFSHPKKTIFVESTRVLFFPCVSSQCWVHFPRSVLQNSVSCVNGLLVKRRFTCAFTYVLKSTDFCRYS